MPQLYGQNKHGIGTTAIFPTAVFSFFSFPENYKFCFRLFFANLSFLFRFLVRDSYGDFSAHLFSSLHWYQLHDWRKKNDLCIYNLPLPLILSVLKRSP